jgi:predicted P-loop ATPase
LTRGRDQIFAEAVACYWSGATWPDAAFERTHIQPEQEARFEGDAWEDTIRKYLENKSRVTVS